MRNGTISKFFLCCRPIDVSDPDSVDCFISVAKMDSNKHHSFRRSVSGAFKKLRETNKRRKLLRQHSTGSSASSSDDSVRSRTNSINDEIALPMLLSPCSSSLSDNSKKLTEEVKTEKKGKLRKSGTISLNYVAMCLLVVSLLMTVLWGKLVAIVMTTIWVYLVRVYLEDDRRRIQGLKNRLCRLWERREKLRKGVWVRFCGCYVAVCKTHNLLRK